MTIFGNSKSLVQVHGHNAQMFVPMNGNACSPWYQQGKIDYNTFCQEFQELSWMDGSRTPLDGKRLKMYIMSMREVVDYYKALYDMLSIINK